MSKYELSGSLWTSVPMALAMFILTGSTSALAQTTASPSPRVEFVATSLSAINMPHSLSPWSMYQGADVIVKAVILSLVFASLLTWTIGLTKYLEFSRERRRLKEGLAALGKAGQLSSVEANESQAVADMILNAEDEIAASEAQANRLDADGIKQRVALRLERVEAALSRRIGKGVGLLAIIGSTAPFVGLFGTVWGVMNSFIGIAQAKITNLSVVAPGIAEALLATAFGLIAAIPAVVIYNLFARSMSALRGEIGDVSAFVMCLAGREIDRSAYEGDR